MPVNEWNDTGLVDETRNTMAFRNREVANFVAAKARSLAPWKSGDLAVSIRVEKSRFDDGGVLVVADGADKFHATFVELGTHKDGAQPFLRPALAAARRVTK
jgi:HK97 gp10 family phage protein